MGFNDQGRLRALIYRAPDVAGQWVAHCLELDLVTQGDSIEHALEMLAESIQIIAEERIAMGLCPFDYRSPPAQDWDMLLSAEPLVTRLLRIGRAPEGVELVSKVRSAG